MIKSIENIIDQYTKDLDECSSPFLTKVTLNRISNDLIPIRQQLNHFKTHKSYTSLNSKYNALVYQVDKTKFNNDKAVEDIKKSRRKSSVIQHVEEVDDISKGVESPSTNIRSQKNDLNELRKRLLQDSNSQLTNDYHENIQQDLMKDLSNLASDLKDGAITLSMKILDDNNLLTKTQENLIKNDNLMNVVGGNLNNYVMNKLGGKISFWFLIKASLGLTLAFVVMLILINFLPRL